MAASLNYFSGLSLSATEKPSLSSLSARNNRRCTSCVCFSNSHSNKVESLNSQWKPSHVARARATKV
jgi:hypothetical protein